ncbi:hypothetical protein GCM10025876_03250 [Demequina litorisediminis]|uniref:Uncharacterized protein n=1 Tax=Demequina litorisediminis TaxID=1849022 RepID=A0ABQ6I8U8_9MICO|nr:hypothetical protein GCM10025876_03250 [Demequina litorisediminis]
MDADHVTVSSCVTSKGRSAEVSAGATGSVSSEEVACAWHPSEREPVPVYSGIPVSATPNPTAAITTTVPYRAGACRTASVVADAPSSIATASTLNRGRRSGGVTPRIHSNITTMTPRSRPSRAPTKGLGRGDMRAPSVWGHANAPHLRAPGTDGVTAPGGVVDDPQTSRMLST